MADVTFNGLTQRFEHHIYDTRKGRLRIQLIDTLYRRYLPFLGQSIHALDAGGGLGQMSQWLLAAGAKVDYFDIAQQMVDSVSGQFQLERQEHRFQSTQSSLQDFKPAITYDFVNCHAVLEWLEDPFDGLVRLTDWVAPEGYLGVMVYNKHMLMLRHMMRGTLDRAMRGELSGDRKGLTPISPIDPAQVRTLLSDRGFKIICQAGIRSFSDLTETTIIEWYDEHDVFNAELELCETPPYRDMARYVLFIAKKSW